MILFEEEEAAPLQLSGDGADDQMNISKTILQQVQEKHIAIRSHNALMDSRLKRRTASCKGCYHLCPDLQLRVLGELPIPNKMRCITEKDLEK